MLGPATGSFEAEPGLIVGEKITPIAWVGLFVPSGKASYPSVAYQLGVPAVVAGVATIALVVPPVPGGAGEVDPAVLVVCRKLGITDVFRVNGPAGIAALGFGTATIAKVRKVVGPGSPAVTCAQVEMQRHGVATMMLLGPTESVVIADETADPIRLAADLLIEAEHGTDSAVVLVTTSSELADAVDVELAAQLADLPERARRGGTGVARGQRWVRAGRSTRRAAAMCPTATPPSTCSSPSPTTPWTRRRSARQRGRDPDRSGHAVQRRQLPHRVPGVAADESGSPKCRRASPSRPSSSARPSPEPMPGARARMTPSIVALADHEGFPAHAAALRRRA